MPGRRRDARAAEPRPAVAVERVHRPRDRAVGGLGERALAHPRRHEAPQHVLLALDLVERDGLAVGDDAEEVEDADRLALVDGVRERLVGRGRARLLAAAGRVARRRVQRLEDLGVVGVRAARLAVAELAGVGQLGRARRAGRPRRGRPATRGRAPPGRSRRGGGRRPGTPRAATRGRGPPPRRAWRRSRPRPGSRPSSTWPRRSRRAGP